MKNWSRLQIGLLLVVLVLGGVVAVLAFMALDPDREECVEGSQVVDAPLDRSPEEALAEFVGANAGDYPLEGWEVESSEGAVTVFTNADDDGSYRVEVETGVVRAFERCES